LVAAYLAIAATTHVALLGIAPVLVSIRAMSRREPLAIFAIGGAIVAVIVGFAALSGHHS
jgi:hypothetical protein